MKKNKSIIDTYNTIYGLDIVVANKYATLEELKELYTYSDGAELDNLMIESQSTTATCTRKSDNCPVILIKYNHGSRIKSVDKKVDFINTICHEAGHVVLDTIRKMQDSLSAENNTEFFCYYLGYVAECIYKTLTKK